MASEAELQIRAKICSDPRLVSSASLLEVPKIFFFGALVHLLCQAIEYAEDGDLWKEDDESSIRFVAALAEWPGDAGVFVHVLRDEVWIDEWMIADWLKFAGDYFYRKYKTNNRSRLVDIYARNGREYGKVRINNRPETSPLQPLGCNGDVSGLKKKHPITHSPAALFPCPPEKEIKEARSETHLGKTTGELADAKKQPRVISLDDGGRFLDLFKKGLLEKGIVVTQDQLTGASLTHLEVFEAFRPVLIFHSIQTIESFYFRCQRCGCSPAWWMMIYIDKVHAVYRERDDGAWLEDGADPVALTMAAILPSYGKLHTPTEAARQFFFEVMIDGQRLKNNEPARWAGRVTGNLIAKEMDLRKGKAGKVTTEDEVRGEVA